MRFKLIFLLFSFTLIINCDNTEVLCVCVPQEISIELLNLDGENLIENGTYDFDAIQVSSQGVPLALSSSTIQKELIFQIIREDGDTSYTIDLNGSETDTLVLNLTLNNNEEVCCPSDVINSVSYNGQGKEIIDNDSEISAKIIIVKP